MSKVIKQMEMDALRSDFQGVRDLVVLSMKGLNCQLEGSLRATLRKKNIRLKMVKNSLTRRVFGELGIPIGVESPMWAGSTTLAWGANSIAELSRAIDEELKKSKNAAAYKDKVNVKGALADGQVIGFDLALTMPTREEAIAQIVGMILGPGSAITGCLTGPISQVASQIQTISEKSENAAGEAVPAAAAKRNTNDRLLRETLLRFKQQAHQERTKRQWLKETEPASLPTSWSWATRSRP